MKKFALVSGITIIQLLLGLGLDNLAIAAADQALADDSLIYSPETIDGAIDELKSILMRDAASPTVGPLTAHYHNSIAFLAVKHLQNDELALDERHRYLGLGLEQAMCGAVSVALSVAKLTNELIAISQGEAKASFDMTQAALDKWALKNASEWKRSEKLFAILQREYKRVDYFKATEAILEFSKISHSVEYAFVSNSKVRKNAGSAVRESIGALCVSVRAWLCYAQKMTQYAMLRRDYEIAAAAASLRPIERFRLRLRHLSLPFRNKNHFIRP